MVLIPAPCFTIPHVNKTSYKYLLSNSKCHLTQSYWLQWFLTKDGDVVTKNSEHMFTTGSRLLNKTQVFSSSCESWRLDLCFILTEASSCLFSFIQPAGRPLGQQVSSGLQLLPWIRSRGRELKLLLKVNTNLTKSENNKTDKTFSCKMTRQVREAFRAPLGFLESFLL